MNDHDAMPYSKGRSLLHLYYLRAKQIELLSLLVDFIMLLHRGGGVVEWLNDSMAQWIARHLVCYSLKET